MDKVRGTLRLIVPLSPAAKFLLVLAGLVALVEFCSRF
jgi:hypothetical protein